MILKFNNVLEIEGKPPSQKDVYEKRLNRIKEAMTWPVGIYENKKYTEYWHNDVYGIKFGKPGKESLDSYKGDKNPHDMRPDIFKDDKNLDLAATFGNVIFSLEEVAKQEKYCVELLGVLMFRSAFLLDHYPVKNSNGDVVYRYLPNQEVVEYITKNIPTIYGVPPIVFLQYIDAIALNEDVKYFNKGRDLSSENIGAKNNYLTYVLLIAVITGDIPVSVIAQKLLRTNVSTITIRDALDVFPHLKA